MFKVLGVECEINPENGMEEFARHWETFYKKMEEIQGVGMYAVYTDYQGNYTAPYRYLIGRKVRADYELSEAERKAGLVLRRIPEKKYEVIAVKGQMPSALLETWKKIWNEKEEKRAYTVDFEEYKSESEVDIYLSID